MYRIIFLLFLLFPIVVFSRSLNGIVINEENSPIAFANVVLLNQDSTYVAGDITDSLGYFEFRELPDAVYNLRISYIGYDDYTMIIPDTGGCVGKLQLQQSAMLLDEVIVKAVLPKTTIKGNALVTKISKTVLADAGTANDVLSKIPLVTGNDGSFTVFGCGTPIIYINGRIVSNPIELNQLSSADISDVEVISNPGAKYSSEANAIIRISTNPPKGEGISASLSNNTRFAHFAYNTCNILLKYRRKGLEVFTNIYFNDGKRMNHEINSMITYDEQIFKQELDSYTTKSTATRFGKVGFNYQISDNHSFGAYYEVGREKIKTHGQTKSYVTIDSHLDQELIQGQNGEDYTFPSHTANVYYSGLIKNVSVDFNGDYFQTKKKIREAYRDNNIIDNSIQDISRIVNTSALNQSRLLAQKIRISFPIHKGRIEFGEEFSNSNVKYFSEYTGANINDGNIKINENNISIYAEILQTFGSINVGGGLRYEHSKYNYYENDILNSTLSRTYNNWYPSLSFSCKIKSVNLSANLTSRTRKPSYRQLDGTFRYVNRYSYQVGNPTLKPVNIYTAQLLTQWSLYFLQALYKYEKNSIFYTTEKYENDPLIKQIVFKNIPHYQQFQIAIGAQPTFGCWTPQLTLGMFYSYYSTYFLDEKLVLNSPFYFFSCDNSLSLNKGWTIDVDFMYQSSGNAQNCYLKQTNYLNIGIRKSFFENKLLLQFKVNDVFNKNNERIIMYNGAIKVGANNYQESRNLILSLRYNFNASRSKYKGTGAGSEEKKRF